MHRKGSNTVLLHIATVPKTLSFLRGQISYMQSQGIKVYALASPGKELNVLTGEEGIETYSIEISRRISPLADVVSVCKLWQYMLRIRPDIVHSHTPKGGVLGMVGAWLARVPVRIYHIHGLRYKTMRGLKRHILILMERLACCLATRVLCVSHSVRSVVINAGLCPEDKIGVLHNGSINGIPAFNKFNPASYRGAREDILAQNAIPAEAPILGFVGRLVRDKGVEEFVEAWKELRGKFPELHWLVLGEFEPFDPVPEETKNVLKTDPRIHLIGYVKDTARYYAAMDILVLPTYREGFGLVLLEAAAMEVPVVATEVEGCIDSVEDGVTGVLVPVHDTNALIEAISKYLNKPALRKQHGSAGRIRVLKDFRPEDIWRAQLEEYKCQLEKYSIEHTIKAG